MKKTIIAFIIIIIIVSSIEIFKSYKEKKEVSNSIIQKENISKDSNKEEYLYKEDLLLLNYTVNEIKIIENKFSATDVKNYLLQKKYNNLTSFLNSPYFNISNIERYQNYYDKNNYDQDQVVIYVEIGLDNKFYTNISPSDTSLGKLILVNKYYNLDSNYDVNLVNIDSKYGIGKMNEEAYEYFIKMVNSALKDNIKLKGVSAYRSYNTQKNKYNEYVKKDGVSKADTYSARPGHSEHQTGLAIDINTANSKDHFENTKEYSWLINNSYKYGFILRYPKDKTFITGYKYEPWHFRYVGIDAATKIFEEQITFEEYVIKYL